MNFTEIKQYFYIIFLLIDDLKRSLGYINGTADTLVQYPDNLNIKGLFENY